MQYSSQPGIFGGYQSNPGQMLGGLPGMNNSQFGMMLQMMMQPLLSQMYGSYGLMPGQFMPTQNLDDLKRNRDFNMAQQAAMARAAEADQKTWFNNLRGANKLAGTGYSEQQLQTMAGDITKILPMASMLLPPSLFSQLHGPADSTVLMSQQIGQTGRYSFDPITGMPGYSAKTMGDLAGRLQKGLYGQGADPSAMHGIRGVHATQLLDEMQLRGMVGRAPVSSADMMLAAKDPKMEEQVRTLQAHHMADKVKGMSGVVSAMREIFGDLGHPNASFPELMNGLEALTQGGVATMGKDRMERIVRTMHRMSQTADITMDQQFQLVGVAGQMAEQHGLDRRFAGENVNSAVAFAHAYGATGGADLGVWGSLSKPQMMMSFLGRRTRAETSALATRYNAVMAIAEELNVKPGSDFANLAEAIKHGKETAMIGGVETNVNSLMDNATLQKLAMKDTPGLSAQGFHTILHNVKYNRQYGEKHRESTDLVMRSQMAEVSRNVTAIARTHLGAKLAGTGISDATLDQLAKLTNDSVFALSDQELKDPRLRNKKLAGLVWQKLTPEQQQAVGGEENLMELGTMSIGAIEKYITDNPQAAHDFGGTTGLIQAFRKGTFDEFLKYRKTQDEAGAVNKKMAWKGTDSPLRRFMGMLSEKTEQPLMKLLLRTMGGVEGEEAVKEMKKQQEEDKAKGRGVDKPVKAGGKDTDGQKVTDVKILITGGEVSIRDTGLKLEFDNLRGKGTTLPDII